MVLNVEDAMVIGSFRHLVLETRALTSDLNSVLCMKLTSVPAFVGELTGSSQATRTLALLMCCEDGTREMRDPTVRNSSANEQGFTR